MFQKCARALPPVFGECKNKQWRAIWARRDVFANGPSASSARNLGKDRFSHPSQNCAANLLGRISQTPLPPPPPPSARQFSNYGAEPWEESVGGGGGQNLGKNGRSAPRFTTQGTERQKKQAACKSQHVVETSKSIFNKPCAKRMYFSTFDRAKSTTPPHPTPPLSRRQGSKSTTEQRSGVKVRRADKV